MNAIIERCPQSDRLRQGRITPILAPCRVEHLLARIGDDLGASPRLHIPAPQPSPMPRSRQRLHTLHAYLTRLEGKLPTLEALATRVGISARRLNGAFAREYGQPIHTFVTERRLTAAYAAIRDTDLPLK